MTQDATNVLVGTDGFVMFGDLATATAPTGDETITELEALGYTEVGYISTDGVTESTSVTTQALNAWQRNARVRTLTTEGSLTFQFTMIETNEASLELYYNQAPAADGSIVDSPGSSAPSRRFVIGVIDGDNFILHYLPNAQVTERGDVQYVNNNAIGRQVTIGANDDASLGGSRKLWFSELAEPVEP